MTDMQVASVFLLWLSISSKYTFYDDCLFLVQSGKKSNRSHTERTEAPPPVSGEREGKASGRLHMGHLGPGPFAPQALEITSEVEASMARFKSEMTRALKGLVSSLKKHFTLPKPGLTQPHY